MNSYKEKNDVTALESWMIPAGAMAQSMLFNIVGAFAMYYYTDVVGISSVAVGILFFCSRIWDGINDPIMGVIADKTHTRWGKFRPYIMFGSILVALLLVLMFSASYVSDSIKFAYICVTYVLFSMAYTMVDIPMWSFPSIMSRNMNRITTILSRTELFTTIGGMVPGILVMPLVARLAKNFADGFRNVAILFASISMVIVFLAGFICKERIHAPQKGLSITNMFSIVFRNGMLLLASLSMTCMSMIVTMKVMLLPYYATYNLGNGELVSLLMIVSGIPGLLGIMFVPKLVKQFDKKKSFLTFMGITTALQFIAYLIGFHDLKHVLIVNAVASLFLFPANAIVVTMFGDCVLYTEWKSGARLEGMIFSFRTLTGKFAASLASLVVSLMLTGSGYVANSPQSPQSLQGIHISITLGSMVIVIIAIIPMLFYKLTNKKVEKIQKNLRAKTLLDD